jgi:hypothetical protein
MDKNKIIFYIILGLVILFALDQILKAIGLKKDKADKDATKAAANLRTSEYFDPMFYRGKAFSSLGKSVSNQYAKEIKSALGLFNDNEEAIYTIFGKLKCKMNISEIAESYYELYGKQMLPSILANLSEKEMYILNDIINKLPEVS